MVTILGFERIQVKGEIVRIMTGVRCEDRQNFKDKKSERSQGALHSISRLILGIVDLYISIID